ncbi:hypothetical protein [Hydrogenophaga sp.]
MAEFEVKVLSCSSRHPRSTYFDVSKIDDDLVERSAMARNKLQRWLAPNL